MKGFLSIWPPCVSGNVAYKSPNVKGVCENWGAKVRLFFRGFFVIVFVGV